MRRIIEQDGKWYEIGRLKKIQDADLGGLFLAYDAECVYLAGDKRDTGRTRHICTLIPDTDPRVVMHKLMESVWASIPDEHKPYVTPEYRKILKDEDYLSGSYRRIWDRDQGSVYPYIILSPPEPEPKTAEELLAAVVQLWKSGSPPSANLPDFIDAISEADEWLKETRDEDAG